MAQRLSSEERVRVDEMARAGVDVDEMARRLGRHRSTVHRELKRCGGRCGYDAEAAQAAADLRARRPKTPKLAGDPVLAAAVGGLLADRMSPHAISAQLRSEGHGICAETVYAACYDHSGARGLPEGSWKLLPRRCRKRRPRGRHARKPSPLGDFKAISQRPASVEDRRQPGHWEGDLIIGKANRSAVATLVERTSRQTLTVALPHGYDAHNTAAAVTAALARQPRHLVKTLTWDQGREMARWPDIEATLGIEVYFCDPHSPWQRPTNEQTNCEYRTAETLAAQEHRPQRGRSAPRHHRRPPQHHAPQAPRLGLSPQRLCCPLSQPPVELAHLCRGRHLYHSGPWRL